MFGDHAMIRNATYIHASIWPEDPIGIVGGSLTSTDIVYRNGRHSRGFTGGLADAPSALASDPCAGRMRSELVTNVGERPVVVEVSR